MAERGRRLRCLWRVPRPVERGTPWCGRSSPLSAMERRGRPGSAGRVLGPHRPTADAGRPPHRQLGRANRENAATALRKPRSSLAGPRTCSVVDW